MDVAAQQFVERRVNVSQGEFILEGQPRTLTAVPIARPEHVLGQTRNRVPTL